MRPGRGSPLRVALVIGHLGYGGAERQLAELALRARGHGVIADVFCLGGSEQPYGTRLRTEGVTVCTVPRRGGFDWRRALHLTTLFRSRRFDVVHSFLIDSNPYAFLAARLARVPAFIASNRNSDFPRTALRAAVDGWVFRHASFVVVNARAVEAFTAQRFTVPRERFRLIYNGVDLETFRPSQPTTGLAAAIGTVGSLFPKKAPELFAEVASAIRARFPGIRCLHLGDGPMRDGLKARYGADVEFRSVSDSVERFLGELDVFVLTSRREGCPNVLLEAMACGRAVVATDAGAVSEIVREGVNGYVVPLGDREALVDRVSTLVADGALRARLGIAARAEVERRFAMPRMVGETIDLYRQAVAAPASSISSS